MSKSLFNDKSTDLFDNLHSQLLNQLKLVQENGGLQNTIAYDMMLRIAGKLVSYPDRELVAADIAKGLSGLPSDLSEAAKEELATLITDVYDSLYTKLKEDFEASVATKVFLKMTEAN